MSIINFMIWSIIFMLILCDVQSEMRRINKTWNTRKKHCTLYYMYSEKGNQLRTANRGKLLSMGEYVEYLPNLPLTCLLLYQYFISAGIEFQSFSSLTLEIQLYCYLLHYVGALGGFIKDTMSLLQPTSNSVELYRNYEYVMYCTVQYVLSVKFKCIILCKETRLLARLHCQTLLSDWLAFFLLW